MKPPQQFTARLEDKIAHNDKFVQYHFELVEPHTMEFSSGQYVSIKVDDKGTRRSYSICSTPAITHGFELLVDVAPQGIGTQYLENMAFGDEVSILGPLGQFTLDESKPGDAIVMIATGSGIAPFRSMIHDLLQHQNDTRPIYMHWGMRHAEKLFWLDEWQDLEKAFGSFRFHPVISRPIPDWNLCRGRVTDCLGLHDLPENAEYYLCGGKPMIDDMIPLLIKRGVPENMIYHEKFF